jgi:hypothetical protein
VNEWLANGLFVAVLVLPLLTLELLKDRIKWLERNHDWLATIVWLVTLLALYVYFAQWGYVINPRLN